MQYICMLLSYIWNVLYGQVLFIAALIIICLNPTYEGTVVF